MARTKSKSEAAGTVPAADAGSASPSSPSGGAATPPVLVHGEMTLGRIFTAREAGLVRRVQEFLAALPPGDPVAPASEILASGLQSLGSVALALEAYPSLRQHSRIGERDRSAETLHKTLLDGGEHGLEWALPTKAVLARTYGIAKVNFFTGLSYALEACANPSCASILQELREATEEAVYARLAEELYAAFLTSRMTTTEVKELAAEHLIDLWEGRTRIATDRFCPLLRSAWAARTRAPRVFGTLLGAQEILTMLFADCNAKFVSWFGQYREDSEQRQAFEEFLFDLPFENLERVRARMREEGKSCVGPREVERYLGLGEGQLRPLVGDPKDLYSSFRRRRVKAQYRSAMGAPGPKRTAEGYLLEGLLLEEAGRDGSPGCDVEE